MILDKQQIKREWTLQRCSPNCRPFKEDKWMQEAASQKNKVNQNGGSNKWVVGIRAARNIC